MDKGVIEYIEGVDHPSEVQEFAFIVSNKNERLIRYIGAGAKQFDTSSWLFVTEHDEDDAKNPIRVATPKRTRYLAVSPFNDMHQTLQRNVL